MLVTRLVRHFILLSFDAANIILHSAGLSLLVKTFQGHNETVQHVYLINLSTIELLKSIIYLALNIIACNYDSLKNLKNNDNNHSNNNNNSSSSKVILHLYVYMVFVAVALQCLYFFAMLFITADRLVATILNIKYNMFWNVSKTKVLLSRVWGFCSVIWLSAITSICVIYGVDVHLKATVYKVHHYTMSMLSIMFLVFAIVSYILMFVSYMRSERKKISFGAGIRRKDTYHIYRNSRFYIAVLLIASYMGLMVVPGVITTSYWAVGSIVPETLALYIDISITLADTADGVIYVFMYTPVRRCLGRLFVSLKLTLQFERSRLSKRNFDVPPISLSVLKSRLNKNSDIELTLQNL